QTLIYILILCTLKVVNAQSVLNGVVVDDITNKPISGVSVSIKGSEVTTQTDSQGHFKLQYEKETILTFRHLGYKNLEIGVKDITEPQIFRLEPAETLLNEVLVNT